DAQSLVEQVGDELLALNEVRRQAVGLALLQEPLAFGEQFSGVVAALLELAEDLVEPRGGGAELVAAGQPWHALDGLFQAVADVVHAIGQLLRLVAERLLVLVDLREELLVWDDEEGERFLVLPRAWASLNVVIDGLDGNPHAVTRADRGVEVARQVGDLVL